jgi:hypothetical protein
LKNINPGQSVPDCSGLDAPLAGIVQAVCKNIINRLIIGRRFLSPVTSRLPVPALMSAMSILTMLKMACYCAGSGGMVMDFMMNLFP